MNSVNVEGEVEVRRVQQPDCSQELSPHTPGAQVLKESSLQKNQMCAFVSF